jgi:hypothetical protein
MVPSSEHPTGHPVYLEQLAYRRRMHLDSAEAIFVKRVHNPILSEYAIYHLLGSLSPFHIGLRQLCFRFQFVLLDDTAGSRCFEALDLVH